MNFKNRQNWIDTVKARRLVQRIARIPVENSVELKNTINTLKIVRNRLDLDY